MQTHIGKEIRLGDILASKSILLDTTIPSCLGATPQLVDLKKVIDQYSTFFTGIIVNPGQMEHLAAGLGGKNRATPLVRIDWTNAYRGVDFCLPGTEIKRIEISSARDVMALGGSAAVATLLMGCSDDFEADNIRSISRLIRDSYQFALPVCVDIRPIGFKVSQVNFEDTIKLGVSFMMEAGADALIIPNCRRDCLNGIVGWSTIPVLVRIDGQIEKSELDNLFNVKIAGVLFSEKILDKKDLAYLQ